MEDPIDQLDAIEERLWSRRGALIRAMEERRRSFTVRLELLYADDEQVTTDEEPEGA